MQGSSNNSFIPKRRNSKRQRSKPGRKVFLLTIVAYSLLFASLLAAGGTVFYKNYTSAQLEKEVVILDKAVNTFSVQDFKRVQEFDAGLDKAQGRVDNTVSIVAVLDELDRITAQPIQISNLKLQRRGDQDLLVSINFLTETLDAALFQRKILNVNSDLVSSVEISEIDIENGAEGASEEGGDIPSEVAFLAEFSVPLGSALYDPAEARMPDMGVMQSLTDADQFGVGLEEDDSDQIIPLETVEANETEI